MKIYLKRTNQAVRFEATNERGHTVNIEGSKDIGGEDSAPSPTELLLMSQAGCTAIDVVELLKKMRQPLKHLEIETEGFRAQDQVPKVFKHIHLHYKLYGNVNPEKAEKAISMSIEKYCTVSKMIDHVAKLTHSFEVILSDTSESLQE
ncbi:MAG TPA: OsmC family protein [Saprospiraceae bacterium]|nr:OsmC family protein [Saprospiraceae bacterium]